MDLGKVPIFDKFKETLANPANRSVVQLETSEIIPAFEWILEDAPQFFIKRTDTETRIFAFERKKVLLLFVWVGQIKG